MPPLPLTTCSSWQRWPWGHEGELALPIVGTTMCSIVVLTLVMCVRVGGQDGGRGANLKDRVRKSWPTIIP